MVTPAGLLPSVVKWLESERAIRSAVLFGSSAGAVKSATVVDGFADFDLHIVTTDTRRLVKVDWARVFPEAKFCQQIVRPATGGVNKVTVLFSSGQIELVLVPALQFYFARLSMILGLHRRIRRLQTALNEVHTCIQSGYYFLKGERTWGPFYSRIMAEMPGVRLTDSEVRDMAGAFLCEFLWVLQKLERGELAAAQLALHRLLSETNFRLVREMHLRRGQPLPSFGLARHVESVLSATELSWVQVDARLDQEELRRAAWHALDGLKGLMSELLPEWRAPLAMVELLAPYSKARG
jgi:hypothetical protein